MRRIAAALFTVLIGLSLCGFGHLGGGGNVQLKFTTITPGGGENSTTHGMYQPQSPDSTHPSASRWADDYSAATRQTQYGNSSEAGYYDNVVAAWSNPIPWSLVDGNYTLNGVAGDLVCAHASQVSNVAGHRLVDSFAVDGGAWGTTGTITEKTTNPITGLLGDACAFTPMSDLADGQHEWRFRSCPANGAGFCAYLSSVKNVSENYGQAPVGTLTNVAASAITGATLVAGLETITYTNTTANGFAVTGATYNSSTHIETVTFNNTSGQVLTEELNALGQTIVIQGITGTGNWNNPAAIVTTTSALNCTSCSVSFNNAAGAPSGTISCPTQCVGASISNYTDALLPGQQIIVQGVVSSPASSYNVPASANVTVSTSYCTAPGTFTTTGNCVVTFTNGVATSTYSSGGLITTPVAVFIDPGQHRVANSLSVSQMVAITGSSDANIANYTVSGTAGSNAGVYCLTSYLAGHPVQSQSVPGPRSTEGKNAFNAGAMQLQPAFFSSSSWTWSCGTPPTGAISAITLTTNGQGIPVESITYSDATCWPYNPGDIVTVTAVTPSTLDLAATANATVSSWSCTGGTGTIVILNNALSPATGSYSSGGTLTQTTDTVSVASDGLGENMTVTDLGAGGNSYLGWKNQETVVQGSLFIWTNAGGAITSTTDYVDSAAGSNGSLTPPISSSGQNPATPYQTLDLAAAAFTNSAFLASNGQTVTNPSGCLTFAATNNTAGAVPIAVGQPFDFRGKNGTMSGSGAATMIINQSYWIQSVSGTSFTIAEYPGAPNSACIPDPASYYTPDNPIEVIADLSFDTAVLECTVPANCPTGEPEQFAWGPIGIFGVTAPGGWLSWTNLKIGCGTQLVSGSTAYFGYRWHFQGGCNTLTPDIGPAAYTFTTTGDVPPLANVGPASPTTYMTGYPAPTPVTSGSANTGTQIVTFNYTDANNKVFQTYTNGANTYGNVLVVTGVVNRTPDTVTNAVISGGSETVSYTDSGSYVYTTGGLVTVSGTTCTGTGCNLNATDKAVTSSSCVGTACQVAFATAASGTYASGGTSWPSDWDCAGPLPTGASPPTSCYVNSTSCNGSGSCTMSYYNTSVVSTSASSLTNADVNTETLSIPVNVPATAGCTTQPCTPPGGVTYRTATTVPNGVAPVGPGGGIAIYATGATPNTILAASSQDCLPFLSGQSDPGMGISAGAVQDVGPPGQPTYIASLDVSGGNAQHLIVSAPWAATYGFVNTIDCPAGTPLTFAGYSFAVIDFGIVPGMWFDHIYGLSVTNISLATVDGGEYVTNSFFNYLSPGTSMALYQNSVMSNMGACWGSFYVIENSTCIALTTTGGDIPAMLVTDPTLPPLSPIFNQPTIVQGNGYSVTATPNTYAVTGGTASAGTPGSITVDYTSASNYAFTPGSSVVVSGVLTSASDWNAIATVTASNCVATACSVTYSLNVIASTYVRAGYVAPPGAFTLQMQGGVPAHASIGWNGTITCPGYTWAERLWVTGINFASDTVTFGSNSGPYGVDGVTIPNSCSGIAVVLWDAGIHTDFNFTNLATGNNKAAGINFPSQIMVNATTLTSSGLWIFQGGSTGSSLDWVFEYDNFAMDGPSGSSFNISFDNQDINWLMLHDQFDRSPFSWSYNRGNVDFYLINSVPNYQISGISLPGGAGTSIETVTYTDATNTVQPVGQIISVLGTTANGAADVSNDTIWSGTVLASPAPGCSGGTCYLSFNNPYSPTGTMTTVGILQIPTRNPLTTGSEGCVGSGAFSVPGVGAPVIPLGTKIWPAWNGGNWSGSGGTNDLTPWYPLGTGTGSGSC